VAQTVFQDRSLYFEDFNGSTSSTWWSENETYRSDVVDGRLVCQLPYDNPSGYRWTYIGLDPALRDVFNNSDKVTLTMHVSPVAVNIYTQIGLMFDLHNVTGTCPGGDFYGIDLSYSDVGQTVQPKFLRTEGCQQSTLDYTTGQITTSRGTDEFSIQKSGTIWTVSVNGLVHLRLQITGSISLDRLKFGQGTVALDEISVIATDLDMPSIEKIASSGNKTGPNLGTLPPRIWAVCAGINDYKARGDDFKNLKAATTDAVNFSAFLRSVPGGKVPEAQLSLLLDRAATADGLMTSMLSMFQNIREQDLFVLFLSGHGSTGQFEAWDDPLRYMDISKLLGQCPAKRKLMIVDACYAGSWEDSRDINGAKGKKLTEEEALALFYAELGGSADGVTKLLAARPEQYSFELKDRGAGLFTMKLLEGLSCAAQLDESPTITIGEIWKYLSVQVPDEASARQLPRQTPVLKGTYVEAMPVSICMKN